MGSVVTVASAAAASSAKISRNTVPRARARCTVPMRPSASSALTAAISAGAAANTSDMSVPGLNVQITMNVAMRVGLLG